MLAGLNTSLQLSTKWGISLKICILLITTFLICLPRLIVLINVLLMYALSQWTHLKKDFCRLIPYPTPVFWPGKFHGQRSLMGYSPWGRKESDTTERITLQYPSAQWVLCLQISLIPKCHMLSRLCFRLKAHSIKSYFSSSSHRSTFSIMMQIKVCTSAMKNNRK